MLALAVVAASEGKYITVLNIGCAFLNTDVTSAYIKAHMRLNLVVNDLLVDIDPQHARFVQERARYLRRGA